MIIITFKERKSTFTHYNDKKKFKLFSKNINIFRSALGQTFRQSEEFFFTSKVGP